MVIMEINMPFMNGMEATEQIMGLAANNTIEKPIIIACTSFIDE